MGKVVTEFNDPGIRELKEGNYRIVYRLKGRHGRGGLCMALHASLATPETLRLIS